MIFDSILFYMTSFINFESKFETNSKIDLLGSQMFVGTTEFLASLLLIDFNKFIVSLLKCSFECEMIPVYINI